MSVANEAIEGNMLSGALSAASLELWEIIRDYIERRGEESPGELALRLLASGFGQADKERRRRLCEDELLPEGEPGLAAPERRWPRDGQPLSQEAILRELIYSYRDDPEIVARLEEFIEKYL